MAELCQHVVLAKKKANEEPTDILFLLKVVSGLISIWKQLTAFSCFPAASLCSKAPAVFYATITVVHCEENPRSISSTSNLLYISGVSLLFFLN